MRIRMLVSIAGADFVLGANDETERFSDAEAVRLIESGSAVPVVELAREVAVKPDVREIRKGKRG